MSERYPLRSGWRPSTSRIVLAGLLGHYAAASAFCAATIGAGFLSDLRSQGLAFLLPTSLGRLLEIAMTGPFMIALLGLWGAILISPSLLVTLPITGLAARKLDADALTTAVLGIGPGLLIGLLIGLGQKPEPFVLIASAAGGTAFALVVWWLCIRRRRIERSKASWPA